MGREESGSKKRWWWWVNMIKVHCMKLLNNLKSIYFFYKCLKKALYD